MIAAFLHAIRETHASESDKESVAGLAKYLRRTPMERLAEVIDTATMRGLMQHYEIVWQYTAGLSEIPDSLPNNISEAIEGIELSLARLPQDDSNWVF